VKAAFDIVAPSDFTTSPMRIYIVNGDYSDYEFEGLNNGITLTIEGESRESTIFTALYSNLTLDANGILLNGTIRIWAEANLIIKSISFKFDQTLTILHRNLIEIDVDSYSCLTLINIVVQELSSLSFLISYLYIFFFFYFYFNFLGGSYPYKWGAVSIKGYCKFISRDCVFLDCRASSEDNGAAIYMFVPTDTHSEVINCSFTNCSTLEGGIFSNGGGIFAQSDSSHTGNSILVSNCSFINCASRTGGGLSLNGFIFFLFI
jgi:hypothetical protein